MKRTKTNRYVIQGIIIFFVIIFSQNISNAQTESGSFEFGGINRKYSVFLPQNYQANMPVVICLHGLGQDVENFIGYTRINEFADSAGFILVFPIGIGKGWNTGAVDSRALPNSDDVGFISDLIDTLNAHYNIDMARIYCTGISNGAQMTQRVAAELGYRFAAVAPVAGTLPDRAVNWDPIYPLPILYMHGTKDPGALYYGGSNWDYWSVEKTLNFWIQNNNCSLTAESILLPDIDTLDNSTVEKISYKDCSNNSDIIHYKIINGGHQWPGANASFVYWGGGVINNDINANAEIWNFVKNYENPLVNMAWAKTVEVFPEYIHQQGDTFFVKAHITNPENHPVSVYAKINGAVVSFSDSLQLYDDGMHFDENPNDNIWGNTKLLSGLEEDKYVVNLYTHDLSDSVIHKHRFPKYFTNIGPLVVGNFEITQVDTNVFELVYELRNDGLTGEAKSVTAEVFTTDTNVTSITGTLNFRNILPGQVSTNATHSTHKIYTKNGLGSMEFIVHIFSSGHFFWSDTLAFTVTGIENETNQPIEYELKQNYPNPFNPTTKINFAIPQKGYVTLKVYNILGKEIVTLDSGEKPAGTYELTWDATNLPSGVYFYQLLAGSFVETKKMILMK
jgi:polyhydroxybutyrate depolymerase